MLLEEVTEIKDLSVLYAGLLTIPFKSIGNTNTNTPVSYTHLTLPTNREV